MASLQLSLFTHTLVPPELSDRRSLNSPSQNNDAEE